MESLKMAVFQADRRQRHISQRTSTIACNYEPSLIWLDV